MKILPVGAQLFHVDGRTDKQTDRERERQTKRQDRRDEANSCFCQFCECTQQMIYIYIYIYIYYICIYYNRVRSPIMGRFIKNRY